MSNAAAPSCFTSITTFPSPREEATISTSEVLLRLCRSGSIANLAADKADEHDDPRDRKQERPEPEHGEDAPDDDQDVPERSSVRPLPESGGERERTSQAECDSDDDILGAVVFTIRDDHDCEREQRQREQACQWRPPSLPEYLRHRDEPSQDLLVEGWPTLHRFVALRVSAGCDGGEHWPRSHPAEIRGASKCLVRAQRAGPSPKCRLRALDNTRPVTRWRRRNSRRITAQP